MPKKKSPKIQIIRELSFDEVVQSEKIYPSRFLGTTKRIKLLKKIGHTCISCGRSASRLQKCKDLKDNNRIFWRILSEDGMEITIDHIKPKSLGGRNVIENYQTMCLECNVNKGNTLGLVRLTYYKGDISGKELWIKTERYRYKGIVDRIDVNPYTRNPEIFIISERGSCYKINKNAFINCKND
jgi:hypothetical protein